jgi:hyperosmotically inducible protein
MYQCLSICGVRQFGRAGDIAELKFSPRLGMQESAGASPMCIGCYPSLGNGKEVSRRKEMKNSGNSNRGSGRLIFVLLLLVVLIGAGYYMITRNASVQNAFHFVKDSTEDATTTSRVRTALLLSKHVSPFDIKVETTQGAVMLNGEVPSEQIKAVAGAIAQDTSGVKEVHNNLAINPSTARNPETERLGERVADLEIKTLVIEGLSQNPELAEKHIATEVKNRTVTLSGTVQTAAQKHAAEQIAWQVAGVQGVTDNLSATNAQTNPESIDEKLAHRVEFELYSTKAISLKTVQIHADNGTVTLTGNVSSRAEKLLAEKTAQSVEGVRKVVNSLAVPDEVQSRTGMEDRTSGG